MNKRDFLKTTATLGIGSLLAGNASADTTFFNTKPSSENSEEPYSLPKLNYSYDALEPYIDEQTMRLHHSKHHQGYVNGLNKALKEVENATEKNDFQLIKHWEKELAFHGAGHFLHVLFWENLSPKATEISDLLMRYFIKDFGSFENFKRYFIASGNSVEGSGWGILAYEPMADRLVVLQAEKHQNLSQWNSIPLFVVDVWEHAYYLKYQNKRKEYITNIFNIANWEFVSKRLKEILS